jgi:ATP-dependent protease ClpP protease subunit
LRLVAALLSLLSCATPSATFLPSITVKAEEQTPRVIEFGDVDDLNMGRAMRQFDRKVAQGERHIWFRVNSFGGSIFTGLDVIQHIELYKKLYAVDVTCVVDTKAMSMGAVFLESACDKRLMTKRSVLLFHNGSTGAEGTVEQIKEEAQILEALNYAMAEMSAARMNITVEQYREKIAKGAWTMGWKEALDVGAIDGTIEPADIPAVM